VHKTRELTAAEEAQRRIKHSLMINQWDYYCTECYKVRIPKKENLITLDYAMGTEQCFLNENDCPSPTETIGETGETKYEYKTLWENHRPTCPKGCSVNFVKCIPTGFVALTKAKRIAARRACAKAVRLLYPIVKLVEKMGKSSTPITQKQFKAMVKKNFREFFMCEKVIKTTKNKTGKCKCSDYEMNMMEQERKETCRSKALGRVPSVFKKAKSVFEAAEKCKGRFFTETAKGKWVETEECKLRLEDPSLTSADCEKLLKEKKQNVVDITAPVKDVPPTLKLLLSASDSFHEIHSLA